MAARLLIELTVGTQIPITLWHQSVWWARYYHPGVDRTVYEERVTEFEDEHSKYLFINDDALLA